MGRAPATRLTVSALAFRKGVVAGVVLVGASHAVSRRDWGVVRGTIHPAGSGAGMQPVVSREPRGQPADIGVIAPAGGRADSPAHVRKLA